MKFSSTVIVAAAAFLPAIEAHCRITDPKPYNGEVNGPLDASGSNFPCMNGGTAEKMQPGKTYTPGQAGSFRITGGATHGGGSCQVSITYDNPPKPTSKFKVVQSYHGGCPVPSNNENLSDNKDDQSYPEAQFTLPEGLKKGEATFVWTWFNRIGNREMYMNCAPITIGGDSTSDEVFESLPDMFVANIQGHGSQCTTTEKQDILFPNPGDNVVEGTGDCNFQPACGGQAPQPQPQPTGAPQPKPTGGEQAPPPGGSYKPPTGGSENAGGDVQKPPVEQNPGDGQDKGTQPTEPAYGVTPTQPALVDVGANPSVTNTPPSSSYTPISDPVDEGSGDNKGGEGSYGGDSGSVGSGSGSGNETGTPVTDDDNTGKKFGALCTQDQEMMQCDGAPAGQFVHCYGKGKGWACQLPGGVECKEFASWYAPQPKAYRFKRHAHEHTKRLNRAHRH